MALDLERIQAICFDVDGTLSDTDDAWMQRITSRLSRLFPRTPIRTLQTIARFLLMTAESPANFLYRILDRLHLDGKLAGLMNLIAHQRKQSKQKQFWAIPGILDLLVRLEGKMLLAVVSARDEHSTLQFLQQFELEEYFKIVVTAQTCVYTKPYPDPILHAARHMNVLPEHCLMVGDTTVDILAGKRAGMQTVGVLCGFGTERELKKAGADVILESTADLIALLKL